MINLVAHCPSTSLGTFSQAFFFIQSAEDTDIHKPNGNVFLPSIKKLEEKEIGKLEILYVGDALDDYEASTDAGLHFCGIANRTVLEEEFSKRDIPHITRIVSLPDFIDGIK